MFRLLMTTATVAVIALSATSSSVALGATSVAQPKAGTCYWEPDGPVLITVGEYRAFYTSSFNCGSAQGYSSFLTALNEEAALNEGCDTSTGGGGTIRVWGCAPGEATLTILLNDVPVQTIDITVDVP